MTCVSAATHRNDLPLAHGSDYYAGGAKIYIRLPKKCRLGPALHVTYQYILVFGSERKTVFRRIPHKHRENVPSPRLDLNPGPQRGTFPPLAGQCWLSSASSRAFAIHSHAGWAVYTLVVSSMYIVLLYIVMWHYSGDDPYCSCSLQPVWCMGIYCLRGHWV